MNKQSNKSEALEVDPGDSGNVRSAGKTSQAILRIATWRKQPVNFFFPLELLRTVRCGITVHRIGVTGQVWGSRSWLVTNVVGLAGHSQ